MTDLNKKEPWTRILKATHHVLELWDSATPFDTDDPEVMAAMDELALASMGVDFSLATAADIICTQTLSELWRGFQDYYAEKVSK